MSAESIPVPSGHPIPDSTPVESPPGSEPHATAPAPPTAPAAPASAPSRRRRLANLVVAKRMATFLVMVALLAAGVAIGYRGFVANQPTVAPTGDPATRDVPTPPSVSDLVVAIAANDPDAVRAAVPPDPYRALTAEMQNVQIKEVTSVEPLSTFVDGPRAVTQLIIQATDTQGMAVVLNLTVLTDNGTIVAFR